MRIKKLRGHKRRWKSIERWRAKSLCFEDNYFNDFKSDYKELLIHPWSGLTVTNSIYPEPNRKTKLRMLEGLLDVFDYWDEELSKRGDDFSLYFWLYDNRFTKSQIVCATGEFINFYDKTFEKEKNEKKEFISPFLSLEERLNKITWNLYLDEDYIDNTFLGTIDEFNSIEEFNDQKKWYNQLLKKKYRDIKLENPGENIKEMFTIKRGYVWVGKIKK